MNKTLFILLVWGIPLFTYASDVELLQAKVNDFYNSIENTFNQKLKGSARALVVDRVYQNNFLLDSGAIDASVSEASIHFKVAYTAFFYTNDKAYVDIMHRSFNILHQKRALLDEHLTKMYGAFIAARMFAEANSLSFEYKNIYNEVDMFVVTSNNVHGRYPVWLLDPKSSILNKTSLQFNKELSIVVVVSLSCHFSQEFFNEIAQNAGLRHLFADKAFYLIPPENELNLQLVKKWNQAKPDLSVLFVDKWADWPEIETWQTPLFNFYWNGVFISSIAGWPKGGSLNEIDARIDEIYKQFRADK